MSFYDSYQDVRHHYEEYDPCEHGQDSRCLECAVAQLERLAEEDTQEIEQLRGLLHGLVTHEPWATGAATQYLARLGLLEETRDAP